MFGPHFNPGTERSTSGTGFGIGIALLPIIFIPILGFGDDEVVA